MPETQLLISNYEPQKMMEKKLKVVLIDDEQHCIDILTTYIEQTNVLEIIKQFNDPREAAAYLAVNTVDVVITDIEMPAVSGIELLEQYNTKTKFIVSSAYPQYAVDGFNYNVVDYLLKPVSFIRFTKMLEKLVETFKPKMLPEASQAGDKFMFVKAEAKGVRQKINYDEITLIEGKTNYIGIRTTEHKAPILVLMNMKDIIQQLPQGAFIRVHSSFIVPVYNIVKIEGNCVVLKNIEQKIPIGISYKQALYELLKIQ